MRIRHSAHEATLISVKFKFERHCATSPAIPLHVILKFRCYFFKFLQYPIFISKGIECPELKNQRRSLNEQIKTAITVLRRYSSVPLASLAGQHLK